MKFENYYDDNKVPEWKDMYIQYTILKKLLDPFTQIVKQQSIKTDKVSNYILIF
jgi:SPX domain protein involved in polyphosphate accumulation